jgi:membrane fusion protein (multidrug efflux system)
MNQGRTQARTKLTGAAVLMLVVGCKGAAPPPAPPPPEVAVVTVTPKSVPTSYEFTAALEPYRRIEVRSRVDGIILDRPFAEGTVVKPGQVLYRLDQVLARAAYTSALARANNANRTLERLEPLVAQNAVAGQDVDNARAEMEAAQGDLEQAKKNLDDTVIRAEIEGRVGRALLDVGARVTGPADLLTTIDVLDPIYLTFRPSDQQLLEWNQDPRARALIQPGSPLTVQIVLPSGAVLPRTGRLDFVAPALDTATGTQEFRAKFQNPDRLLLPGQFVRARLTGFTRDSAMAVPQRAVQQALGRQFVYVVGRGDTVAARDVRPGPWSGNLWIIDSGLVAGDRVVVDGTQKIGPGRPARAVALADTATLAGAQMGVSGASDE